MMEKAVFLLIPAALFAIMFALGLGLSWDSVQMVKDRPGLWIRLLLGTCLLVPLVALGLLNLPLSHALSGPSRFAIALMAICPSAPLSLRKAGQGLQIEVRDHGPGVPEDQLPQLAQAFYRPESARTRSTGGVGLGLYLCKLVASAHGGRFEVRNAQPGLAVTVTLPGA